MNPLYQIAKYARNTLVVGAILAASVVPAHAASKVDVEKAKGIVEAKGTPFNYEGMRDIVVDSEAHVSGFSLDLGNGLSLTYFPKADELKASETFQRKGKEAERSATDKGLEGTVDKTRGEALIRMGIPPKLERFPVSKSEGQTLYDAAIAKANS